MWFRCFLACSGKYTVLVEVGNSLIGYVDLGEFIREYKITWGEEAKELKSSVQELDVKITNLLNADLYREFCEKKIEISRAEFLKLNPFHWGFEFYEVFELDKPKEEIGFDVVIGNPPYLQ